MKISGKITQAVLTVPSCNVLGKLPINRAYLELGLVALKGNWDKYVTLANINWLMK